MLVTWPLAPSVRWSLQTGGWERGWGEGKGAVPGSRLLEYSPSEQAKEGAAWPVENGRLSLTYINPCVRAEC